MGARASTVKLFVRLVSHTTGEPFAPAELRQRLAADAEQQGTNVTAVALAILGQTYNVGVATNGSRTTPNADPAAPLQLRLPHDLYQAIGTSAARRMQNNQTEVLASLCKHYGLELPAAAAAA